jgi:hypothetical protein
MDPTAARSSLVTVFGEPSPERGRVEDRDASHLSEAQEIAVGADHVVGAPGDGTLQELVVRGIAAHPDRDVGLDEHGASPESKRNGAGLAWSHAKFSPELRARGHSVDFGEDRLGDEEDELVSAPRFIESSCEALGAGEGAPQEQLRVKNDRERGQRGAPRR